jgi:hypothetical protein
VLLEIESECEGRQVGPVMAQIPRQEFRTGPDAIDPGWLENSQEQMHLPGVRERRGADARLEPAKEETCRRKLHRTRKSSYQSCISKWRN